MGPVASGERVLSTITASGRSLAGLEAAAPEEIGLSAAALDRMTQRFQEDVDRGLLPGVQLLVSRRGKLATFESLGHSDPTTGTAMAADTIFRIFSMTKPIVSVAAMMLFEEGRYAVSDPLAKYLPAFADVKVGVERGGRLELEPMQRPITVQDLLRHTSGFTYDFTGANAVQKLYAAARFHRRDRTNAEHAAALAELPLMYQPGTKWEYSRSTDILGHLVELWSGKSLGTFLQERIFAPLGMVDTGFFVPPEKLARVAQAFPRDPETGQLLQPLDASDAGGRLFDVAQPPKFESGGGGLMSTMADYTLFCRMLAGRGSLDGIRLIGRKTHAWMTADHLGKIDNNHALLAPNLGFGLGFCVQREPGGGPSPGSKGMYFWGGIAGTTFWVDPEEDLLAILMVQAPGQRTYVRGLFRALVYATLDD
jgi:CubicO group peptidase (beta-lactamase class C family)